MQVISERNKKEYSGEFKCAHCERTLRIDLADLYWISFENERFDGTHREVVFTCVCRRRNRLNDRIPEWVKNEVFRKKKGKR